MLVDWISAFCECPRWQAEGYRPYDTGRVLLLGRGGELERESSRGITLEGSYDDRLLIQSRTGADLYLSGNPVKYIQGHNLFGPCDPVRLFFDAGWEVRKAVGLFPSAQTWEVGFQGPRFTRIDLTRSYRFPTADAARSWLRESGGSARSRHGGAVNTDGTIYFGKNSERWSLKCYHKGDELLARRKGHRLPDELVHREKLLSWAVGVVRFEVTLRSKELEKLDLKQWNPLQIWQQYFDKVTWNQNAQMAEADMFESELKGELRKTLVLWRAGADLRALLGSKATYYRHRQQLLKAVGVDIASPPPKTPAAPGGASLGLDQKGWDPEPLEGYAWTPEGQHPLV
jgi:hypothetical protein